MVLNNKNRTFLERPEPFKFIMKKKRNRIIDVIIKEFKKNIETG